MSNNRLKEVNRMNFRITMGLLLVTVLVLGYLYDREQSSTEAEPVPVQADPGIKDLKF